MKIEPPKLISRRLCLRRRLPIVSGGTLESVNIPTKKYMVFKGTKRRRPKIQEITVPHTFIV